MPPGLLGTYFPGEDPMAPVDLMPRGLLGPSVLGRMQAHSDAQRQRMATGDYSPTPMDEESMWLADDLAGGLLGSLPGGLMVLGAKALPMDQASRMARAREMGFGVDSPVYHGTNSDVPAFTRSDGGNMWGDYPYLTSNAEDASAYATGWHNRITPDGDADPNVIKAFLRSGRYFDMDAPMSKSEMKKLTRALDTEDGYYSEIIDDPLGPRTGQEFWQMLWQNEPGGPNGVADILRAHGYDGIVGGGDGIAGSPGTKTVMPFDPANIRSVHAAFDPAKRDSADLLAGMAGLSGLGLLGAAQVYPYIEDVE